MVVNRRVLALSSQARCRQDPDLPLTRLPLPAPVPRTSPLFPQPTCRAVDLPPWHPAHTTRAPGIPAAALSSLAHCASDQGPKSALPVCYLVLLAPALGPRGRPGTTRPPSALLLGSMVLKCPSVNAPLPTPFPHFSCRQEGG
ncbi:hypothetical protein NDU88_005921 [Pleurodeles waltl]|uniref:Uncharacterized protein n=1 Tax=Pleurodeles waltl TaxID=8319 RepID=A0AAV7X252_PLEWA|nr:hypothetical protein NDU88_005921 [Pleurodeles waltl]